MRVHPMFVVLAVITTLSATLRQPLPQSPPATPGPVSVDQTPRPAERCSVYALFSASGWSEHWNDYNTNAAFVPNMIPGVPGTPDMRYYYSRIGEVCTEMGVDGVILTTPDIRIPRTPDPIQHWRYRMEGRQDALNEGALAISDRNAIIEGMVLLRQKVQRIILYTGYPYDVSPQDVVFPNGQTNDGENHNYLTRDRDLLDGYLRANLGPWLDSGMVEVVLVDATGNSYQKPVPAAVIKGIKRLWPAVRVGGEGHPAQLSGPFFTTCPFNCSATTYTSATTVNSPLEVPWRVQITNKFWPVIVEFTEPHGFVPSAPNYHPSRYDDALAQLRLDRSVAIQDWPVGFPNPTPENRARWDDFMRQARQIKADFNRPQAPDNPEGARLTQPPQNRNPRRHKRRRSQLV